MHTCVCTVEGGGACHHVCTGVEWGGVRGACDCVCTWVGWGEGFMLPCLCTG